MSRSRVLILLGLVLLMIVPVGVALAQAFEGSGTGIISDAAALSDRVVINMTDVTPPSQGTFYEGWLVSDDGETKLSLGLMQVRSDGTISHTFVSPTGENLIDTYNKLVVTVEPDPDPDPANPSDIISHSNVVSSVVIGNIRNLLVSSSVDTQDDEGILTALKGDLDDAILHANLARNSTTLASIRQHLEHTINIIEGGQRDVDGAGGGQNPCDCLGVLTFANSAMTEAAAAATAGSFDADVVNGASNVQTDAQNVIDLAGQARDIAEQTIGVDSIVVAKLRIGPGANSVISFLEAAKEGFDANGNGTIQSISGEGGADQAYVEAQRMATYNIEPGLPIDRGLGTGLPPVGDTTVPVVARFALIFGMAFLGFGALILVRTRRTRVKA